MSQAALDFASHCFMVWVSGFVFGYTLKTIKQFVEKI